MLNKIKKLITKLTRKHLLVIKVENVNAPPVIIYKGKKIQTISEVDFDWETHTEFLNGYDFSIKRLFKDENKLPVIERTGFRNPSKDEF